MPRILFHLWVIGVLILVPVVFTADQFFVREYGPLAGYLIGLLLWVFMAALSYMVFRLFAQTFLRG